MWRGAHSCAKYWIFWRVNIGNSERGTRYEHKGSETSYIGPMYIGNRIRTTVYERNISNAPSFIFSTALFPPGILKRTKSWWPQRRDWPKYETFDRKLFALSISGIIVMFHSSLFFPFSLSFFLFLLLFFSITKDKRKKVERVFFSNSFLADFDFKRWWGIKIFCN